MTHLDEPSRRIRSFVRREGRMTPAQKAALETLWSRYGLEPEGAPLDLAQVFGRTAPTTLEIGFGNGDSLLAQALANPDRNFIGVEVHRPGVGRFLACVHQHGLCNVRMFCADAVPLLQARIVPGSLDCVQVYFPDPWPKKRHHKRRLVQHGFADLIAHALGPGGRWLLATDWADYAEQMRDTLNAHAGFVNLAPDGGFLPRPPERMETRFERRGRQLGHAVFDLAYQRKAT